MKLKKVIKIIVGGILSLILIVFVFSIIPRVKNPSPAYQTDLIYGTPLSEEINGLLTPKVAPERTRAIVILENEYILASYSDGRYSIDIDEYLAIKIHYIHLVNCFV